MEKSAKFEPIAHPSTAPSSSQVRCDSKEHPKALSPDQIKRIEESEQKTEPKQQPYASAYLQRS